MSSPGSDRLASVPRRGLLTWSVLIALTVFSLGAALLIGSAGLSVGDIAHLFLGRGSEVTSTVVLELRLPRALAALAVGGLLALSGALLQVLLENPLADPYVLGVSGGAAFGALLALSLGAGGGWMTGSAFLGALLSITIVFGLARGSGTWNPARLLLTGVVMASGWGALVVLLLALAPEGEMRGMVFWLMGDLSQAHSPLSALLALAFGLLLVLPLRRSLNVLSLGEIQAATLGVEVGRLRLYLYLAASALTAVAISVGGTIGFVGLIVPHLLRLTIGPDHRLLLPASALLGGSLLVLADTLARSVIAPQQLPVGVITALLGVPLFLFLLARAFRQ